MATYVLPRYVLIQPRRVAQRALVQEVGWPVRPQGVVRGEMGGLRAVVEPTSPTTSSLSSLTRLRPPVLGALPHAVNAVETRAPVRGGHGGRATVHRVNTLAVGCPVTILVVATSQRRRTSEGCAKV